MADKLRIRYHLCDSRPTPAGRIIESAALGGNSRVGRERPRHYAHRALVLLVRGGGFYRDTESIARELAPGDLWFVEPAVGHAYGPPAGGDWEEFYVSYEGPVFDALAAAGAPARSRPVLRLGDPRPWRKRLTGVLPPADAPSTRAVDAERQIGALVEFILAAHAAAQPEEASARPEEPWLTRARQLLGAPGPEAPGLAEVARACGLGAESFRKRFAERTGEPPGRYRLLARVEQAKRLLQDRDWPVRVVAEATGFCDEFHFSKTFRRIVGAGPREWRAKARVT